MMYSVVPTVAKKEMLWGFCRLCGCLVYFSMKMKYTKKKRNYVRVCVRMNDKDEIEEFHVAGLKRWTVVERLVLHCLCYWIRMHCNVPYQNLNIRSIFRIDLHLLNKIQHIQPINYSVVFKKQRGCDWGRRGVSNLCICSAHSER